MSKLASRPQRRGLATVLVAALAAPWAAFMLDSKPTALAAPGSPGTPGEPTLVFEETFEVGQGVNATKLGEYVGVNGQTHTADPFWLNYSQCNGVLMRYEMPHITGEYCEVGGRDLREARNNTRRLADVLGQLNAGVEGSSSTSTPVNASDTASKLNHAVTAFTHTANGPDDALMLSTSALNIVAPETRFYVASVDVAELSCEHMGGVNNSALNFTLVSGATQWQITDSAITACQSPNVRYYNSPGLDGGWFYGGDYVAAGTFHTDGSALLTPAQALNLTVQMRNETGATDGNDSSFDNIRIYDATPQLDKEFSPAQVPVGQVSTLTLTITNTSDLAAKSGWSFTDTLPAGLVLADDPNLASTCDATIQADGGDDQIVVTNGTMESGETHCEVTVNVTSDEEGEFTNGPSNITSRTGLLPPDPTTVTFTPLPQLELTKESDGSTTSRVGDIVTYTVEATNVGDGDFTASNPAVVIDDLSGVLDDADDIAGPQDLEATIAGVPVASPAYERPLISWSGPLASGQTVVITYTVQLEEGGDRLVTNVAFPTDPPFDPEDPPTTPECGTAGAVCTEFPLPLLGSISWDKTSAAPESERLAGSEWALVPLDEDDREMPAGRIAIVDCVATTPANCTAADRNAATGRFLIEDLELGKYNLYETKAPAGFKLLDSAVAVTLSADALDQGGNLNLGPIENDQQEVPTIPLTGGVGEFSFLIAGGGLALLLAVLLAVRHRSTRRSTSCA